MSSNKRKRVMPQAEIEELLWSSDSEVDDVFLDRGNDEDQSEHEEERNLDTAGPSTARVNVPIIHKWSQVEDVCKEVPDKVKGVIEYDTQHTVIGFENLTPYDCFCKLFPEAIYEHVAVETNRYAAEKIEKKMPLPPKSRFHKWKDVSAEDIKAFIAIEIAMGLVHKPAQDDYFEDSFWLTQTPGFRSVFSRDQYKLIRFCLHLVNTNESDTSDRLYKIRPILDMTKELYASVYVPNRELSVDETMVKFKGRLFFKQYMPSKPSSKWGVKIWSLCDSHTGYLLKFNVYTGKDVTCELGGGLGSRVVQTLLSKFENNGHIVYMDNFFSGIPLYDALRQKNIGACGTVRVNRQGLPRDMRGKTLKRGDLPIIYIDDESSMLACMWQDTGRVNMLSTIGDTGIKKVVVKSKKGNREVSKPSVQVLYNKFMGGVDRFDQLCSTYPFNRKNMRWYLCVWYFIIETALVNSRICYNVQNPDKKLTQKKFRKKVIDEMLDNYSRSTNVRRRGHRMTTPTAIRLKERHFLSQFEDKLHRPNCVVCSILPSQCKKKGKGECKRKQTSYFCSDCQGEPPLCAVGCFKLYHTKKNYKKYCNCA